MTKAANKRQRAPAKATAKNGAGSANASKQLPVGVGSEIGAETGAASGGRVGVGVAVSQPAEVRGAVQFPDATMILAALPHPILLVDESQQIRFANSAAELFFQTSRLLLLRLRLPDVVAFGSPLLSLVEQVMRSGASVNEYGVDLGLPRIGEQKIVDIFAGPMSETPTLTMVILQQRSMAQMIERQFTHRAAARSVSGMAAVLAHEIKNPLSGIRGAAQLIEPALDEDNRALARLICSETDRICKLVDRMEAFGDERPLAKESINIHSVLDHVRRIAASGFARHIKFEDDYDPSLPSVPGNHDQLIQAILNLVKNAAEAIGEDRKDGRIVLRTAFRPGVRLTIPGSRARISLPLMIQIEDNGSGVPEALRAHLFDPFVTTKPAGTGLGLALVAKIVGDHGGVIECDPLARGTVFRVLMPLQDSERARNR